MKNRTARQDRRREFLADFANQFNEIYIPDGELRAVLPSFGLDEAKFRSLQRLARRTTPEGRAARDRCQDVYNVLILPKIERLHRT